MKKAFVSFLVLTFLVMFGSSASYATSIGFEPASQTVDLGTQVNAALVISGLGGGTALGVFDVTISFDPLILAYSSVTFGDPVLGDQLGLGSLPITFETPSTGAVELFELSFDSPADLNSLQASSFTLATLAFDAVGVGTSSLDMTIHSLGDAYGASITADITNGSVDVQASAIPEPSVLLLLASGLVALGLIAKKRTSAKSAA
jgi:hypothetical protein